MSKNNPKKLNKKSEPNPNDKTSFETKLSIIKLFASENIIKLMIIFLATLVIEVLLFAIFGLQGKPEFVEAAVYAVRIPIYIVMAVSFVLVCYIVSNTLTGKSAKPVYTIQRLRITEKDIFKLNCVYNTLVFITYIGFQVLAALLMILIHRHIGSSADGPQNIMMAFYRTPFFHSAMPMENWILLIRNTFYVWALGVQTALMSQRSREGKTVYGLYFTAALILISFIYDPMKSSAMVIRPKEIITYLIAVPFAVTAYAAGKTHREDKWKDDEFEASLMEYRNQDEEFV